MGKGHHSCGVAICRNTSINAKKRGLAIHFFRFPQDPDVKKEWIVKCCRIDKNFNPNNARICSGHFTLDDYEDSLKARIMGKTPIKLKKNAVPTLLLHPSTSTKKVTRKKLKETISQLAKGNSDQKEMPISESTSTSSHSNGSKSINPTMKEQSHDLELERRVSQFMSSKVQILVAELI